jgi:hypothetical protein
MSLMSNSRSLLCDLLMDSLMRPKSDSPGAIQVCLASPNSGALPFPMRWIILDSGILSWAGVILAIAMQFR